MTKISKSPLLALVGLAAVGMAALSTPAAAQTIFHANFRLTNANAVDAVTISGVSWSGSYTPQLPATVGAGVTASGSLKNVFPTGSSQLTFTATYSNTPADNCLFTFNMNNATGDITVAGTVQHGNASCSSTGAGVNPVLFSIDHP